MTIKGRKTRRQGFISIEDLLEVTRSMYEHEFLGTYPDPEIVDSFAQEIATAYAPLVHTELV